MSTPKDVQRALTPVTSQGIHSLNSDSMFVLDFVQPVYKKRPGFSNKRAVLKRIIGSDGDGVARMQRERICAELFAIVHPAIAPEVEDDDEMKNALRIRWVDGDKFSNCSEDRLSQTKLFDCGVIRQVDHLIYHRDRHGGNAMVNRSHVIPIDHEHCLEQAPFNGTHGWNMLGYGGGPRTRTKAFKRGRHHALDQIEKHARKITNLLNTNKSGWTTTPKEIIEWARHERGVLLADERKAA